MTILCGIFFCHFADSTAQTLLAQPDSTMSMPAVAAVGSLAAIAVTYFMSPAMPGATTAISRFTKHTFYMPERDSEFFCQTTFLQ